MSGATTLRSYVIRPAFIATLCATRTGSGGTRPSASARTAESAGEGVSRSSRALRTASAVTETTVACLFDVGNIPAGPLKIAHAVPNLP